MGVAVMLLLAVAAACIGLHPAAGLDGEAQANEQAALTTKDELPIPAPGPIGESAVGGLSHDLRRSLYKLLPKKLSVKTIQHTIEVKCRRMRSQIGLVKGRIGLV